MRFMLILVCALSFLASPVLAQKDEKSTVIFDENLRWLEVLPENPLSLEAVDDVSDGCWTNATATRNAVELEFTRSGYRVNEDGLNSVTLYAMGYEIDDRSCVIYISFIFSALDVSIINNSGYKVSSIRISEL